MILYAFFILSALTLIVSAHDDGFAVRRYGVRLMMMITRLFPLHHPLADLPEAQRHIGETVFDSSLHPAQAALLQSLHQLRKPKRDRRSWSQRMTQWFNRGHH